MNRVFVDTNVFLRFFTRDDAGHHERAKGLFESAAEGKVELVTGPPVLFEVYWTLVSGYRHNAQDALDVIESILNQRGITLTDTRLVEDAVTLARRKGGEFADAYIYALARSQKCDSVATFNEKDFRALGADVASEL